MLSIYQLVLSKCIYVFQCRFLQIVAFLCVTCFAFNNSLRIGLMLQLTFYSSSVACIIFCQLLILVIREIFKRIYHRYIFAFSFSSFIDFYNDFDHIQILFFIFFTIIFCVPCFSQFFIFLFLIDLVPVVTLNTIFSKNVFFILFSLIHINIFLKSLKLVYLFNHKKRSNMY